MNTQELNQDMFFTVLGVDTWDWIPLLHAYGPLKKCTIKIKDIINLLNNGVSVRLRDEQNEQLYLFLKKYHLYLDSINSNLPRASVAEDILYKRVHKTTQTRELIEQISNPLEIDPREDNFEIVSEKVLSSKKDSGVGTIKGIEVKQKIKKPRAYEIIGESVNEFSSITSTDNDLYKEIDFDVD